MTAGTETDGRAARAARTRRSIVEAHFALICEGDLKPSGERIAQRAGVSLRTLWAYFKDMESLFAATSELLTEWQDEIAVPVDTGRPLRERLDDYCRQRVRMLEIVAPSARASQLREPFSPLLRQARQTRIARVRQELEEVFAAELAVAGPGREELLAALVVAVSSPAWAMLRDELGLGAEAAAAVLRRHVTALLCSAVQAGLPV